MSNRLSEFAVRRQQIDFIDFLQGVYLAKNTFQAAVVRGGEKVPGECAGQPAIPTKWEPSEASPIWKAALLSRAA